LTRHSGTSSMLPEFLQFSPALVETGSASLYRAMRCIPWIAILPTRQLSIGEQKTPVNRCADSDTGHQTSSQLANACT
jgi:hypothetical protein